MQHSTLVKVQIRKLRYTSMFAYRYQKASNHPKRRVSLISLLSSHHRFFPQKQANTFSSVKEWQNDLAAESEPIHPQHVIS